jgi:hypothetical protein
MIVVGSTIITDTTTTTLLLDKDNEDPTTATTTAAIRRHRPRRQHFPSATEIVAFYQASRIWMTYLAFAASSVRGSAVDGRFNHLLPISC